MENPMTWGEAEKIVSRVITEHHELMSREPGLCGLSLERRITDALREADFLSDIPLSLQHHRENHEAAWEEGCKYCDKERATNEPA